MTRSRALAIVAVLSVLAPAVGRAQDCRGCAADDTAPRSHIFPAIGVHVGAPQKASAAVGVVLGEDWQRNGRDHSRNVALFAEPGLGGGRASLSYLRHGYGSFGSGFGVGATVLRTWKDPWTVKPNLTFVGADVLLWPVVFIGPRVGAFRLVSGNGGQKKWLFTFDVGFGV